MNILSSQLDKITNKIFKKRGFYQTKILSDWELIVGDKLCDITLPSKISFREYKNKTTGILEVFVKDNNTSIELHYIKDYIIEKITIYFGYKAVDRIKIFIKPELFVRPTKKEFDINNFEINKKQTVELKEKMQYIDDEELKESLFNLGKLIIINSNRINNES